MQFTKLAARIIFAFSLALTRCVNADAADCCESSITSRTPFMGNNDEIFKQSDESVWQFKYEYLYQYYPSVTTCPVIGKLLIGGTSLQVAQVSSAPSANASSSSSDEDSTSTVIESRIEGESKGWDGKTIIKLTNGQIFQQIEHYYNYQYKYRPMVLIYQSGSSYKIRIEGIDRAVRVKRLK